MSRPAARAFTLIELLVVVAIIALLISILLPSFAAARRQAKRSVCGSNLHQIGLAMPMYCQDNRDFYPSEPQDPNDPYNMVWEWGGYGDGHYDAPGEVYVRPSERRVMFRYLAPEYFKCPDDRGMPPDNIPSYKGTGTSYPLNGYNWDGYATVFPLSFGRLGVLTRKTTHVTNPKCVMTGDAVMDEFWADIDPFPDPGTTGPGAMRRWHDLSAPRANLLFADASVNFVLINRTQQGHGITDLNRSYWWWEGKGYSYSFCPTHPARRDERPWYFSGH